MSEKSRFRKELEDAILERHCANHPMTGIWARGELGRDALRGWAVEHYHWVSHMSTPNFYICAHAPKDVINLQVDNFGDENDDERPHLDIVLRFAEANGADIDEVKKGRGLPTTRAWVDWLTKTALNESWIAGIAATRVGTESQSPLLYSKVLPALREKYKFSEDEIEHFWLHSEADIEHGDRGFSALERHCTTRELQDEAIHFARESARMRWFYFDGIFLHYEQGYDLR
jgi:pyrroloquinoline-quinone synthase